MKKSLPYIIKLFLRHEPLSLLVNPIMQSDNVFFDAILKTASVRTCFLESLVEMPQL